MTGRRRATTVAIAVVAAAPALGAQPGRPPVPVPAAACDTTGWSAVRHLVLDAAQGTVHVGGDDRTGGCLAVQGAGVRTRLVGDTLRVVIPGGTGVAAPVVRVRLPVGAAVRAVTNGATVTVDATRGPVAVRAAAGRLVLAGVSEVTGDLGAARLVARAVAGGVRLRSATGPVTLDDVGGDLVVDGGSGDVVARGTEGTVVSLRTTSGRLRWQGAPDPVGRYDFRTATGPIDLALAPAAPVAGHTEFLRAAVTLGPGLVETERDLVGARTRIAWATVPAPVAPAAPTVHVRTTTGAVRIVRAAALPGPAARR